ncbi:hypothetical protein PHYBLDRAFT_59890 [Phycomyces blakesleeanus NRRL 1555(-)]|uniref:Uncharacterized protein n=1 Tax=Phycomyces blakesleeanus (strain ATCC 8743b / DSM 1359 / FGSC 10004 / NBRC 33097 / NRRL 1555) TaxID=763407 RepID=A0A162UI03_PHYB8|nr:hypothetical protein PHYBLDRAFT_59890 [Phycomyces blakesleeanus NRRL 1555(-)]OAD76352.1 hypothetical protein PHYBLDRAFT_59890 [Phycomyces blakesleeanus NRRL 1555(-)]|eukprot:XP_018294392.1 hypothetical protein PHYBLDRAFT_59890 [Phycomyces blakesleeanus NRRL 1555(-)]
MSLRMCCVYSPLVCLGNINFAQSMDRWLLSTLLPTPLIFSSYYFFHFPFGASQFIEYIRLNIRVKKKGFGYKGIEVLQTTATCTSKCIPKWRAIGLDKMIEPNTR